MQSNGITVDARDSDNVISPNVKGTHLKTAPPKYIIKTCIMHIPDIIKMNGIFFLISDNIHKRSLRDVKQLAMPEKINRA